MHEAEYIGLVSVVIPTYNRAKLLSRSVASCLEQTYPHVEVIVVDDGSTDHTPQVLAAFEEKYGRERFRWVRQDNAGPAVARNTGMDMARGEFLQFLDSDDFLDPEKFAVQVAALRGCAAAVAVCDYRCVADSSGASVLEEVRNSGDLHRKIAGYWTGSIWTASPLIRRERIPPYLRWNPNVVPTEDADFMFKFFLGLKEWCYTPGFLCNWVHHQEERVSQPGNSRKPKYWEDVDSFYSYWEEHRSSIPEENRWMVSQWAAGVFREGVRHSRDRALLRRFSSLAFRRPWSGRIFLLSLRAGIKSMLPFRLLDWVASLRRK
jgi:glycosyltransferase involved in cell wall biosynthesis